MLNVKTRLKEYNNVTYVNDNFRNIKNILDNLGIEKVDGILADLGYLLINWIMLRGFSYMNDAALDMRMNRDQEFSAYDLVNGYSEEELEKIIRNYGEERFARRIARFIVDRRAKKTIESTFELVDIIKAAIPAKARREGPHPAKRTFQAIRIEVNGELEILNRFVEDGVNNLAEGGRIAHNIPLLEDRIIKLKFRNWQIPAPVLQTFLFARW